MRNAVAAVARWLAKPPSVRGWTVRFGVANLLAVFLTTILATLITNSGSWPARILLSLAALLVVLVGAYLLAVATSIREARFPTYPDIVLAMTRELSAVLRRESSRELVISPQGVRRAAMEDLKSILRALEDVLSDAWSKKRFGERTDLEVVLMKRAPDGYVTVACWASTRPLSLANRDADPTFYESTEAAKLYRKYNDQRTRAPIHLIPDVSTYPGYDHFGRDPRIRTNSTALFPVYDTDSRLHGFVAVTARLRTGLFREEDRDFWNETWNLWEPHLLRHILRYEATGATLGEVIL